MLRFPLEFRSVSRCNRGRDTRDLISFTVPSAGSESVPGVRAILATHIAHESAKTLRRSLAHLLGAIGGLVVACVLFPDVASHQVEQALLGIWGACFLFVVGTAVVEWRLHRHEARLLTDNHGDPES